MSGRPLVWIGGLVTAATAIGLLCYLGIAGLDNADKLGSVIGALTALAGLMTAIYGTALTRRNELVGDTELDQAASALAAGVRQRWKAELETLELRRPDPLPLRWRPAHGSASMVESYGELDTMVDDFLALDKKQLVVLGGAGAGKSVLAMLLTVGLLERRRPHDPVPVLLSLSSWTADEHLHSFVARRLSEDHLGLAKEMASRLVAGGRLLPILDGLDEIPKGLLLTALDGIDRAVGGSEPVVITSREEQYSRTIVLGGRKLAAAAVAEILPVPVEDLIAFLQIESGWQPVIENLRADPDGPLAAALSSPLMAWMGRTMYRDDPDTSPAELLEFTDADEIQRHLLDAFIDARYRTEHASRPTPDLVPRKQPRYRPQDARKWLTFLASHSQVSGGRNLEVAGTRDFAWWRLKDAMPQPVLWIVIAISLTAIFGPIFASYSEGWDVVAAWSSGPLIAFNLWLFRSRLFQLADAARPSFWQSAVAIVDSTAFRALWAVGGGVWCILLALSTLKPEYFLAVAVLGPLFLLGISVILVAVAGIPGTDITPTMTPLRMLVHDRSSYIQLSIGYALFLLALDVGMTLMHLKPAIAPPLGSVSVFALIQFTITAWFAFSVARIWFAIRGSLPLRLMRFLEDAHSRGILRRSGAVYQFRHVRLQETLADRHPD